MESKTLHTLFRLVVAWTLVPSGILFTGAGQLQTPERDLQVHRSVAHEDSRAGQYRGGTLIASSLGAGNQSAWKQPIEVPCLRPNQTGFFGGYKIALCGSSSAFSRIDDPLSAAIVHWLQENSGRPFWSIAFEFASRCDQ